MMTDMRQHEQRSSSAAFLLPTVASIVITFVPGESRVQPDQAPGNRIH